MSSWLLRSNIRMAAGALNRHRNKNISLKTLPSDVKSLDESRDNNSLEYVIASQGVEQDLIERAKRAAAESGQPFAKTLLQLGFANERDIARAYATLLQTTVVDPTRYTASEIMPFVKTLTTRFLLASRVIPLLVQEGRLVVAMADPTDSFAIAAIKAATGMDLRIEVGVPIEIEAALERIIGTATIISNLGSIHPPIDPDIDTQRLKELASDAPIIRLVTQIFDRAVETGASDIHVEPFEGRLRIRYRYDGVLHEIDSHPPHMAAAITSCIKILAKLDIAERRLPQDGRIKQTVRGRDIDIRVSTASSLHGEHIALRILDRGSIILHPSELGLSQLVSNRLANALELPNGMVLVTGPTGSGKTTTLYAALRSLNSSERKLITIEDPVEYQLDGITQLQVKPSIGLQFANLLRSIVRLDPDVIMIGEIRDLETAQIATQAALTGHLVLSTLHTNSAASSVTRLRDMGLEPYLVSAVLRGVLAQRLVRVLCVACRRLAAPRAELLRQAGLPTHTAGAPTMLWHAVGCVHCRGTGYRGRQAIAEFLLPTQEVTQLVFDHASHTEVERAAVTGGMRSIFDAGRDAVLLGITTIEEITRTIRLEECSTDHNEHIRPIDTAIAHSI